MTFTLNTPDRSSVYNLINSVRWSSPKLRFCVFARATKSNHPRVCQKFCHGSVHLNKFSI